MHSMSMIIGSEQGKACSTGRLLLSHSRLRKSNGKDGINTGKAALLVKGNGCFYLLCTFTGFNAASSAIWHKKNVVCDVTLFPPPFSIHGPDWFELIFLHISLTELPPNLYVIYVFI